MIGKIDKIVLDTTDATGLAEFYREVTGFPTVYASDDWVNNQTPDGVHLSFQRIDHHVAPRWPDPAYPQQMHLDLLVPDLASAVERARQAGATRLPGGGDSYVVLADPAGHPFCLCQRDGVDGVRLADICLDCPDGSALAPFYAALLGMEVTYEGPEGAMLAADGRPAVVFQNVATHRPPRWPDPAYPQQVHLDVEVADVDEAERQVLALGATRLPGGGEDFRVYADPVGHPFCLVW